MAAELSAQNKDDVQVHSTLGVLLASEKQYRAAQFELEKANALQPETRISCINRPLAPFTDAAVIMAYAAWRLHRRPMSLR